MSLDRFGQADELIILCWSHCLCLNYASPFGTDESAWDKQWWNLRPSPTVRDWQVTCKTGTFLGFTDDFIIKLVLKSIQGRRQFFRPKTQWHGVLSKRCLHCDKVKQDIHFSSLISGPLNRKYRTSKTRQLPSCWPKMKLPLTDWYTRPRTPNVLTFLKALSICTNFIQYNVSLLCLRRESTVVLDKNKTLLETWK